MSLTVMIVGVALSAQFVVAGLILAQSFPIQTRPDRNSSDTSRDRAVVSQNDLRYPINWTEAQKTRLYWFMVSGFLALIGGSLIVVPLFVHLAFSISEAIGGDQMNWRLLIFGLSFTVVCASLGRLLMRRTNPSQGNTKRQNDSPQGAQSTGHSQQSNSEQTPIWLMVISTILMLGVLVGMGMLAFSLISLNFVMLGN